MTGRAKRAIVFSLCLFLLVPWNLVSKPALGAPLNVSDPTTYVTETFSDRVGWGFGSPYPLERRYSFFSGAEGTVELILTSPWLRYLGLTIVNANGKVVNSRDLYYYQGSSCRTVFSIGAGLYAVRISGNVWGAYTNNIPFELTLTHPQSAPQIELCSPADTAIVSHGTEVGVERRDIPSNPEVARLEVFLAGNPIANLSSSPFKFVLNTDTLANTFHQLEFRAYDELGRYNPLTSRIEVRNLAPDTETQSFKGRIGWGSSLLYPTFKDYAFEMRRAGPFNAVISGDRWLRYLAWRITDGTGKLVCYHDFYYEGTYVRAPAYLAPGNYTLRIFDMGFWHQDPFISYLLTLDYPAKRKVIDNLTVTPAAFDPSEDNGDAGLRNAAISYKTLERAYLTLEIKNAEGSLVKALLSNLDQAPGSYLSSWDGLDDQGDIAEEGAYSVILNSFDDKNTLLDSASTQVEVTYHLGD